MSKLMMLNELEAYALEYKIPIMQKDGILYLCNYIKENKIKKVLEIGSAIGYSAIQMALVSNDIKITTIEKDEERYKQAIENIDKFNLNSQIKIYNIDALDYSDTDKYDLIFIDAAKSKNITFFKKFANNLADHGVIITDNLSFHGLVEDSNLIKTKNQEGIVRKIKDYINFLDNNCEFITEYISVGDKIAISKKNKN